MLDSRRRHCISALGGFAQGCLTDGVHAFIIKVVICASSFTGEAMDKLNNSVRINEVDPNHFVALFVPGGHGTHTSPITQESFSYCSLKYAMHISTLSGRCGILPHISARKPHAERSEM